jgi:hypothetical protein
MKDRDIRLALKDKLLMQFGSDPDTLILDELGLCQGSVRIDMAVVNGALHGYEIKSERDTLERLPHQQASYSKVFDEVTIVVGQCYLSCIRDHVPVWWGIVLAVPDRSGTARLVSKRKAKRNPRVDAYAVAQLLWRDETLELLSEIGTLDGLRSKPRKFLWQALADQLPLNDLRTKVREKLVSRKEWRSGASPAQDGARCPPCAM